MLNIHITIGRVQHTFTKGKWQVDGFQFRGIPSQQQGKQTASLNKTIALMPSDMDSPMGCSNQHQIITHYGAEVFTFSFLSPSPPTDIQTYKRLISLYPINYTCNRLTNFLCFTKTNQISQKNSSQKNVMSFSEAQVLRNQKLSLGAT